MRPPRGCKPTLLASHDIMCRGHAAMCERAMAAEIEPIVRGVTLVFEVAQATYLRVNGALRSKKRPKQRATHGMADPWLKRVWQ